MQGKKSDINQRKPKKQPEAQQQIVRKKSIQHLYS